jgi:hypothetical protein
MYGTCSSRGAAAVSNLGGIPIDYQHQDFVEEIHRLTDAGVDVVFDGIGGAIWRSRKALRPGGKVVAYGFTSSLRAGRLASGHSGGRHRFRAIVIFGLYTAGGWLLPGGKRVVPCSIQWLKRLRPALFRQDLVLISEYSSRWQSQIVINRQSLIGVHHSRYEQTRRGDSKTLPFCCRFSRFSSISCREKLAGRFHSRNVTPTYAVEGMSNGRTIGFVNYVLLGMESGLVRGWNTIRS